MKLTLESTQMIVQLETEQGTVPARIWCGKTESGTPCFAFIAMIAPEIAMDDQRQAEFEAELDECVEPSAGVVAWLGSQYWGKPQ